MNRPELIPVENNEFCPFFDEEPQTSANKKWYKVYNDGGHYIASLVTRSRRKGKNNAVKREEIDYLFDNLYRNARFDDLKEKETTEYIKAGVAELFPDYPDLDGYIADKIERAKRNFWKRVKRLRRKANLNKWNYFVTFTYDDKKHSAESFRKKIRRCLSNLHTRRGWRYMGVFERAPETGRLHFHGIMYIPDGEMIGKITEIQDYSTAQGKIQTRHENNFFVENFGRNDFEELSKMSMKNGQAIKYLLKYVGKTGERFVYSRGVKSEIYAKLDENDVVTEMQDFGTKYVLFDDTFDWERDVMRFNYKQLSMIDLLCNSPQAA